MRRIGGQGRPYRAAAECKRGRSETDALMMERAGVVPPGDEAAKQAHSGAGLSFRLRGECPTMRENTRENAAGLS